MSKLQSFTHNTRINHPFYIFKKQMITEKDVLDYIYANKDDIVKLQTINNMTYAFLNLLNGGAKKKVESKSNHSNLPDEEFTQKLNGYG